jgi:hypothetical protein
MKTLRSILRRSTALFAFTILSVSLQAQTQDVVWQQKVNTASSLPVAGGGSWLTRTGGGAGWLADAVSVQLLPGDGYVEWKFDQIDKRMAVGVSYLNVSQSCRLSILGW